MRMLIVDAFVGSGTVAAGSVTDSAGGTYTKIDSAVKAASADTLYLFVRTTAVAAAAMTVTVDVTGDSATGFAGIVYAIDSPSAYGASAVRQSAKAENQAAAGTPAVTFASETLQGNAIVGAVANATNPATVTPPALLLESIDNGYATPTTGFEAAMTGIGFVGTTLTWGGTSASAFCVLAAEISRSSVAGGAGGACEATL